MSVPLHFISKRRYFHTVAIAVLMSALIVSLAATLGRATLTLRGAVIQKPDIAVFLLMEARNDDISDATLLRGDDLQREYMVETHSGPKWVRLKKGEIEWYISEVEVLHQ